MNFIRIPIIATGTCAPLRADRVLLEAQVMRLLCSSLNTRGFATVGAFDATHTWASRLAKAEMLCVLAFLNKNRKPHGCGAGSASEVASTASS